MRPTTPNQRMAVAASCLTLLALSGCLTPPVVVQAHNPAWTLESSRYPENAILVEIHAEEAGGRVALPALRGLFVPANDGAPVVVHFAESGASVTSSPMPRSQYQALAEIGFASLAVDYRGVGLSDGETSPRDLDRDALRIWEHALTLVDDDPARLVLRGASLGTIAASSLLARGLRPAACIAFAPVRPGTVAVRWGYARFWNPVVWLASPLLRSFSDADPLRWLCQSSVPCFVVASPEDELLGKRDFRRLREGFQASGGAFEIPDLPAIENANHDPIRAALAKHIALADCSFVVTAAEETFLTSLFPRARSTDAARVRASLTLPD